MLWVRPKLPRFIFLPILPQGESSYLEKGSPLGCDIREKRRWAVRTISDMLSNEKYAGNSAYGKTVIAEYPSMRQIRNDPDQVSRSENHHPAIIDKACFDRVQELRLLRTNMETDERGNRVRKSTHYSFCPKGSAKTQEE